MSPTNIIFSFKTFHLGLQMLGSKFNLADLSRTMCSYLYDVPETSSMSRMLGLTGALWQMVRSGGAVPARTLDSVIIVTNDFGFTEINNVADTNNCNGNLSLQFDRRKGSAREFYSTSISTNHDKVARSPKSYDVEAPSLAKYLWSSLERKLSIINICYIYVVRP